MIPSNHSGEWFYYALINACKKRERGEAIKSALLQKTRFFRCIFFEIFFWGLQELFLLSSALQMVLQMKHLYCMQPFQASCLDKLHHKTQKVQKRGCMLAFSSFQKILFMKRFFFSCHLAKKQPRFAWRCDRIFQWHSFQPRWLRLHRILKGTTTYFKQLDFWY